MNETGREALLGGLLKIGREIGAKQELGSLLETLLTSVLESLNAERGFILMTDDEGALKARASLHIDPESAEVGDASRTAINQAMEKGEAVLIEDARQDPRFAGSSSVIMQSIRSIGVVPLRLGEEIIGVLYMDSRLGENSFSEQSLDALRLFGALAAQAIDRAQAFAALQEENIRLRRAAGRFAFEEIIGQSKAMERVFALMERVAPTDLPVLIHGESGTGKELIARAVHNAGSRGDKPFLALFAGNLGEELLESELFGHVKGAFTGAHSDKPGLLTLADGGTLMLDEVADIPPRIQAKLLRVLQDGDFKPVGGTKT
ncbi:GAF domain-containing protein, partial [bacterium]|nr:GAF domain-containing protein [bacterium]